MRTTPVPGAGLEGYVDHPAATAGETIDVRLSGPEGTVAALDVVRITDGDSGLHDAGYGSEPQPWGARRDVRLASRAIDFGNRIEIAPDPRLTPDGDFSVLTWVYPTLVGPGWHALASCWSSERMSWGLFLGGGNAFKAAVSVDGRRAAWCTSPAPFIQGWQLVGFTWRAREGRLALLQLFPSDPDDVAESSVDTAPGSVCALDAPVLIGALSEGPGAHWAHFNGRLARPRIVGRALQADELQDAAAADPGEAVAAWDFGASPASAQIVDRGPHALHGIAHNAPKRAVTGPAWREVPPHLIQIQSPRLRWQDCPGRYDAIHFHDDALDDARWPASASLPVPAGVRSGVYAARISNAVDELIVPFVVEPRRPTARVLVLVASLTWQAYSTNRMVFSSTPCGVIDRGVCRYDLHSDGSTNYHVPWRRPTRTLAPHLNRHDYGANQLAADMFLIGWLEREGIAYDVLTEHTLHVRGDAALAGYRCVMLGAHPEYWTRPMLNALGAYVGRAGSRVMLLGGNALDSVTSLDPQTLVMECRNDSSSMLEPVTPRPWPGETQHATDGVPGNRGWREAGVPVHELLGTETRALTGRQLRQGSLGYRRTTASHEPQNAWIFDGVLDELIGAYGKHLGTAAGYEGDGVPEDAWRTRGETVVLARASGPTMGPLNDAVSPEMHLALTRHHSGAAAFVAGSMTWSGALGVAGGDNDVSRITGNVLRRFLSDDLV